MKFKKVVIRKAAGSKKSQGGINALNQLNSFLNASKPEPVYWLRQLNKNQQNAITYKEIREAILNGHMSESTLQAWQQDYSKFVTDHMAPTWISAMEAASQGIVDTKAGFFFDPTWPGITNWVKDHGAQFVTNSTTEQKNAIQALIARAYNSGQSPDELSRAIRPCIGLTQRQSIANANYYQHVKDTLMKNYPNMKESTAAKMAQEAAAKYAEQQHRYRADMIAETELAFAYQHGEYEGIKMAQAQGYYGAMVKIWSTAYDDGVCDICNGLEGTEIGLDDDFNFPINVKLFNGQRLTPPAHPFCRCAVEYKEISPPVQIPDPNVATANPAAPPQPQVPDPAQPQVPDSLQMPPGMTDKGQIYMGGTGEMHACEDANGEQWLFKPAQSKGGTPEAFRAYAQEAGYKVQGIVDPDSAVKVGTGDISGQFGAYQQRIDTLKKGDPGYFDYKKWQHYGGDLSPEQIQQLQREHVTDWLLGNFDSHGGNFVTDVNGRIIGIDKEQAFRYIQDPKSKAMSYGYHPNSIHGETEPIYNTMYRRYAQGTLDMNLQDSLTYIKRIEAIPDAEYREIFHDYAYALKGSKKDAEALLDSIVERKTTLRETYRTFYTDLLTQRTGKKQALFVFADEAAPSTATIQTQTFSVGALSNMDKATLLQLAKNQGIAYYNNMNKQQLIDSLSDPAKAQQCSQDVKNRLAANAAKRNANTAATVAQTSSGNLPQGTIKADDLFSDFSTIGTQEKQGYAVWSDGDKVEGLNLTARRMTIDGEDYYEVTGKLRESAWNDVRHNLYGPNNSGIGTKGNMVFETTDPSTIAWTASTEVRVPMGIHSVSIYADPYDPKAATFEMFNDKHQRLNSCQGYFRIRVRATADGVADAKKAADLLRTAGIEEVTTTPTAIAEETFKKARLIWQQAPHRTAELNNLTGNALIQKIDDIARQEGINLSRINNMVLQKEYNGYITYVEKGAAQELEKAGAKYVWAGITREADVVKVIESGGMSSTMSRISQGIANPGGASMADDMYSGGANSVFTRLATNGAAKKGERFNNSFMGGHFRVKMDTSILERTDYYAFEGDMYGEVARIPKYGKSPLEFVQDMQTRYRSSNEIMFRNGIDSRYFTEICCETDTERNSLISALKNRGITEINGVDINTFITVGSGL